MRTIDELIDYSQVLAIRMHNGQVDKGGEDYYKHPFRVADICKQYGKDAVIVALLHDTIEDTSLSLTDLRQMGYPENIVSAVDAITRRDGETYDSFIRRCGENETARLVKMADLKDNLDVSRLPSVSESDIQRLNKYISAFRYLKLL